MNYFFKKTQQGNLLLGLLVSLGIIALLSAMSIPYLRQYQPSLKLNGVAKELVSDLRYAQQLTITEQVVHKVYLDFDNDDYQILRIDTATTTIKSVDFPSDINFKEITDLTNNEVIFNSYGAVSESGGITLINSVNKEKQINIKPSGYIQLMQ